MEDCEKKMEKFEPLNTEIENTGKIKKNIYWWI